MADMVFQDVRIMDQSTIPDLDIPRDTTTVTVTATAPAVADTSRFMLSFKTHNAPLLWVLISSRIVSLKVLATYVPLYLVLVTW